MENKIKDFLITFNGELENSNRYCNLQYFDNGYVEGISFPEIQLFDDATDSTEYVEELTLSRLVKTLNGVLSVAEQELSYKVDKFFAQKKIELKEKFPNAKVKFNFDKTLQYSTFASGDYIDEEMFNALDVVKQDFEYIFEGLKLYVDV